MRKAKYMSELINIFNNIEVNGLFTIKHLFDKLAETFPDIHQKNLHYFLALSKISKCHEIDHREKTVCWYKKIRNIDQDDLDLASAELQEKQEKRIAQRVTDKILEGDQPKIIGESTPKLPDNEAIIPSEQNEVQKVVEACLVLTKENIALKDENIFLNSKIEALSKENTELKEKINGLKEPSMLDKLFQLAEKRTGISLSDLEKK